MVKLYEKLSMDQIAQLVPKVQELLVDVGSYRESDGSAKSSRFVIPNDWDDSVSEPLMRAVHSIMLARGNPAKLPKPFTHVFRGFTTEIVMELAEGLMTRPQAQQLGGQVLSTLRYNNLVRKVTPGSSRELWVAPWPVGKQLKVIRYLKDTLPLKERIIIDRRIAEEADKPVDTHFDLSTIPLPGPDPESILNYVAKLKQSFDKLNNQFEQTKAELAELKQKAQWSDIPEKLGEIVKGS